MVGMQPQDEADQDVSMIDANFKEDVWAFMQADAYDSEAKVEEKEENRALDLNQADQITYVIEQTMAEEAKIERHCDEDDYSGECDDDDFDMDETNHDGDDAGGLENDAKTLEETTIREENETIPHAQSPDGSETNLTDADVAIVSPPKNPNSEVGNLELLMALWAEKSGISRWDYQALREVLATATPAEIETLPKSLGVMKKKAVQTIGTLEVCSKKIPVIPAKIATLTKAERSGDFKRAMYFVRIESLLEGIIKSKSFVDKNHVGIGVFTKSPKELWESEAGTTSIVATSGDYIYYPNSSNPILPGDYVQFATHHVYKVKGVGKDSDTGKVMVDVWQTLDNQVCEVISASPPLTSNELVLSTTTTLRVEANQISCQVYVWQDWNWGLEAKVKRWDENKSGCHFMVRRVVGADGRLRRLADTVPIQAEFEKIAYRGRKGVIDLMRPSDCGVLTIPYQIFIDGFEVYYNMH
ncbi:hypothetical protein KEM56_000659 [Ascosphaera pollenicola]|nr:hypothetical protein KEM56_000659 [Ascosphaera pollenicola]